MLRTQQNIIAIKDPSVRKPRFKFCLTDYQLCDLQILFRLSEPQHPHQQAEINHGITVKIIQYPLLVYSFLQKYL